MADETIRVFHRCNSKTFARCNKSNSCWWVFRPQYKLHSVRVYATASQLLDSLNFPFVSATCFRLCSCLCPCLMPATFPVFMSLSCSCICCIALKRISVGLSHALLWHYISRISQMIKSAIHKVIRINFMCMSSMFIAPQSFFYRIFLLKMK